MKKTYPPKEEIIKHWEETYVDNGNNGMFWMTKGLRRTLSTRKKQREAKLGTKQSDEHKAKRIKAIRHSHKLAARMSSRYGITHREALALISARTRKRKNLSKPLKRELTLEQEIKQGETNNANTTTTAGHNNSQHKPLK